MKKGGVRNAPNKTCACGKNESWTHLGLKRQSIPQVTKKLENRIPKKSNNLFSIKMTYFIRVLLPPRSVSVAASIFDP